MKTDDNKDGTPAAIPCSGAPHINSADGSTLGRTLWFAVLWIIFTGTCSLFAVPLAIDSIPLGSWFVPVVVTAGVLSLVIGTTTTLLIIQYPKRHQQAKVTESGRWTRKHTTIGTITLLLLIPCMYLSGIGGREFDEWRNGRKAEASQSHFAVAKFLDGGLDFHPDALNQTLAELEDGRRQLEGNWTIPEDSGPISVNIFRDLGSYHDWLNRRDALGSVHCIQHGPTIAIPLERAPSASESDHYTRTPVHEVVHAMMCQSLGREKFSEIPRWFHEGVAEYYAVKGILRIKLRVVNRAIVWRARDQLIESARFCAEDFYPSSTSEMLLFYATSLELVEVLVVRNLCNDGLMGTGPFPGHTGLYGNYRRAI